MRAVPRRGREPAARGRARRGVPRELVAKKLATDGPSPRAVYAELDGAHLAAFATEPGPRSSAAPRGTSPPNGCPRARSTCSSSTRRASSRSRARSRSRGGPPPAPARRPAAAPAGQQGRTPSPSTARRSPGSPTATGAAPRARLLPRHTWRLHPDLAAAVSTLSYEDRLRAHPLAAARRLDGVAPGVRQVLVEHRAAPCARRRRRPRSCARSRTPRPVLDDDGRRRRARASARAGRRARRRPVQRAVWAVRGALRDAGYPDVEVGTVDRFQGKEAPVVILTLAASSGHEASRGLGFLLVPEPPQRRGVARPVERGRRALARAHRHAAPSARGLEELGAFLALTS
nr:hypothetical protein [Cellulosimicrobium sp. MM]